MRQTEGKKIIVGLSGGVDSSATAAILKSNGYNVCGVHFVLDRKNETNIRDVKKICSHLGIPLKVVNARNKFRQRVIGYFIREYENGRTPNPCVMCNPEIKFKLLLEEMAKMKADCIATGHYARLRREIPNSKLQKSNLAYRTSISSVESQAGKSKTANIKFENIVRLFEAKDKTKDQSYFLYRLAQKELSKAMFPLGDYKKTQVRAMAKKFGLPVYKKEESQDVCFLPSSGIENFLARHIRMKPGQIVDDSGKVIGKHKGLPLYTFGQRRGINIGGTGPYYVVAKDAKKNILKVTNCSHNPAFSSSDMRLSDVTWTAGEPELPAKYLITTRYHKKQAYGTIKSHNTKRVARNKKIIVEFDSPETLITPGQSAVFYTRKGEVAGGGIIT